jgi:hypothetical protein
MFCSFVVPHPKADHCDCHAVNAPLLGEPTLGSPLRKQQGAWTRGEFRPKPERRSDATAGVGPKTSDPHQLRVKKTRQTTCLKEQPRQPTVL